MDVTSVTTAVTAMQQSVQATHLQMALLRKNVEMQTEGLLKMLETAQRASGNPPHLGNRIDTTA
jgi:hypothetical protein